MNKTIAKLEIALRDFESGRGAYFDVTEEHSWNLAHVFEALLQTEGHRYQEEGNLVSTGSTVKRWVKYTKVEE